MKNREVKIRVSEQTKDLWQEEALSRGLTLSGLIVKSVGDYIGKGEVSKEEAVVKEKPVRVGKEFKTYFKK